MRSLFSLLALCCPDSHCQDPASNLSPQKYVDAFAMAEVIIVTTMCIHTFSLCSLQQTLVSWTKSVYQQPGGWEPKDFPRTRFLASCRQVLIVCSAMAKNQPAWLDQNQTHVIIPTTFPNPVAAWQGQEPDFHHITKLCCLKFRLTHT